MRAGGERLTEPGASAWEALILPLNQACELYFG